MATYLDFSVKTREQFKTFILRSLGEGLITVELSDDQLNLCIDNALELFSMWVTFDQQYLAIDVKDYVEDVGYTMPSNVVDISNLQDDLLAVGNVNMLFSLGNTLLNSGNWPSFRGGSYNWLQYEQAMQFIDLTKRMTGGGFKFNYSCRSKILTLYPDPIKEKMEGHIVLGVYVMRPEQEQMGEMWVKKYALANAKVILGTVRSKFANVQLLGGGTIDTSIGQIGQEEMKELESQLPSMSGPANFWLM